MNIYIIEVEEKYKIGITQDITERLNALQAANPSSLKLIHSFSTNDGRGAETFLHRIFKNKRIRNEWFALTPGDVSFIKTINGFVNGAFTWEAAMPAPTSYANDSLRPVVIFKFTDYQGEEFHITERQIFDFLQTAWKRQQGGSHPLSRRWWTVDKRPRLNLPQYRAIVSILVDNAIIINRRMGSGGSLSMSPTEAMAIIVRAG